MKKLGIIAAAFALLGAGLLFAPAHAADFEGCTSDTGVLANQYMDTCGGGSANGTGYVYVDGNEGNPEPMDGFISAANDGSQDEDGVCASAEGDPGEEYDQYGNRIEDDAETPACDDGLVGLVSVFVGG
jgi:hypothetical protein